MAELTEALSPEQAAEITAYVDVQAPPPPGRPTAHLVFGTNQPAPALLAADRYHQGLAPLIILTGGVNRHTGVVEARAFCRLLRERGVPEPAIRCEDQSRNTWQNVELALPYLREAAAAGLPLTAVCKWYHRRVVHVLRTLLPDTDGVYAVTWEPVYGGVPVTRDNWPGHPDGRRRVLREWQEVTRRVADGTLAPATRHQGAWR